MLAKIRNLYDSYTAAEKNIADVVLACPQAVTDMTVGELAKLAGTAPSAVSRFCKTAGTDGFAKLKLLLSAETAKISASDALPSVCPDNSVAKVFEDVFFTGVSTLQDTLSMLDFKETEKICKVFSNAGRIVFFGVGTSSVVAMDASYRFAQLGLAASASTDVLFMNVVAANLKKGDVAVFISHSGNTKATVDAFRKAKKVGATTVAITSFLKSILSEECDCRVVSFPNEQKYPVEAVSARLAHICIIDAFMMSLATQKSDCLQKYIGTRNEILQDIRYTK